MSWLSQRVTWHHPLTQLGLAGAPSHVYVLPRKRGRRNESGCGFVLLVVFVVALNLLKAFPEVGYFLTRGALPPWCGNQELIFLVFVLSGHRDMTPIVANCPLHARLNWNVPSQEKPVLFPHLLRAGAEPRCLVWGQWDMVETGGFQVKRWHRS